MRGSEVPSPLLQVGKLRYNQAFSATSRGHSTESRFPEVSGAMTGFCVIGYLSVHLSLHAGEPLRNARGAVNYLSRYQVGQSTSLDGNSKYCLGETLL